MPRQKNAPMIRNNRPVFSLSVMCLDFDSRHAEVPLLDAIGIDSFHIDIMDGAFVPNFALTLDDLSQIRQMTRKPLDVHLMVSNPIPYLPHLLGARVSAIYIHYETGNAAKHLHAIKDCGIKTGLAINPGTDLSEFKNLLPVVDKLLVMRVHPGGAGRPAVPSVEMKLEELANMRNRNFKISLDGAVSAQVIAKWSLLGIEEFVLGTASKIVGSGRSNRPYGEIMRELRQNCIHGEVGTCSLKDATHSTRSRMVPGM